MEHGKQEGYERMNRPLRSHSPNHNRVQLLISHFVLKLVHKERLKALAAAKERGPIPLPECTGDSTRTMGIPCAHAIQQILSGQELRAGDFHTQWWITGRQHIAPVQQFNNLV